MTFRKLLMLVLLLSSAYQKQSYVAKPEAAESNLYFLRDKNFLRQEGRNLTDRGNFKIAKYSPKKCTIVHGSKKNKGC